MASQPASQNSGIEIRLVARAPGGKTCAVVAKVGRLAGRFFSWPKWVDVAEVPFGKVMVTGLQAIWRSLMQTLSSSVI